MFTMLNRIIWLNALVLFTILSPNPSKADMASEIDHLIEYIESSDCTFIRNEKVHDNQNASDHIQKKYAHTKRWIKSTEDFIKYAATESSMSGRPYYVKCDGIRIPTAQWLTEELARFRNKTQ
jgi:hypothetical protein